MASVNKVLLIGNLTRDVELRYTPSGAAVGKFGLAMNRKWSGEDGQVYEEVTFVDVECWSKTAENTAKYSKKGSCVHIEGRLKLDQWEDKQSGQKRSKLGVVAERITFLSSPVGERTEGETPSNRPTRRPAAAPAAEPVAGDGPPESDDVPF